MFHSNAKKVFVSYTNAWLTDTSHSSIFKVVAVINGTVRAVNQPSFISIAINFIKFNVSSSLAKVRTNKGLGICIIHTAGVENALNNYRSTFI